MNSTAFTLEEADEICEDFEDLRDTEFAYNGDTILVDDVVVSPIPEAATSEIAPTETRYDVVIIASGLPPANTQYRIGIREYIAFKGVSYNFPS